MRKKFSIKRKEIRDTKGIRDTFWGGFKNKAGGIVAILLFLALAIGSVAMVVKYTPYRFNGMTLYKIPNSAELEAPSGPESLLDITESAESEFHSRVAIICPEGTTTSFISVVNTTDGVYYLGPFALDYRHRKVALDGGELRETTETLYYLPEKWVRDFVTEAVHYEELLRNPPLRKEVRGDPTFYKGVDYSSDVPFDEVEITVDAVYFYTDTNETGYNFVFRVFERSTDLNIADVTIKYPENCEFNPYAKMWT